MQESSSKLRVGLVQMVSGKSPSENLAAARIEVAACAKAGAKIVVLPEMFAIFGVSDQLAAGMAEKTATGPIRSFMSSLAREYSVWLVGGTVPTTAANPYTQAPELQDRVYAASYVYNSEGQELTRYDKVHLFDAQVNDAQGAYRESKTFAPGIAPVSVDSPWGRLGIAVCYDLRFPEYFRKLSEQACDLVVVPAAFTYKTGEAHWELLLRARAVENQCFMLGAAQGGHHSERRQTWGHSLGVDPWGELIAELGLGQGHCIAELDFEFMAECRQSLPVLEHRRID